MEQRIVGVCQLLGQYYAAYGVAFDISAVRRLYTSLDSRGRAASVASGGPARRTLDPFEVSVGIYGWGVVRAILDQLGIDSAGIDWASLHQRVVDRLQPGARVPLFSALHAEPARSSSSRMQPASPTIDAPVGPSGAATGAGMLVARDRRMNASDRVTGASGVLDAAALVAVDQDVAPDPLHGDLVVFAEECGGSDPDADVIVADQLVVASDAGAAGDCASCVALQKQVGELKQALAAQRKAKKVAQQQCRRLIQYEET